MLAAGVGVMLISPRVLVLRDAPLEYLHGDADVEVPPCYHHLAVYPTVLPSHHQSAQPRYHPSLLPFTLSHDLIAPAADRFTSLPCRWPRKGGTTPAPTGTIPATTPSQCACFRCTCRAHVGTSSFMRYTRTFHHRCT